MQRPRPGLAPVRLATARVDGTTRAVRIDHDVAVLLPYADLAEAFSSGPDWRQRIPSAAGITVPAASLDFSPVIPRPEKIICAGLNFRQHAKEAGREIPDHPTLFAKFWRALVGPRDNIELPPESTAVDWEAELALVIGQTIRRGDRGRASAAIAGYTVANDISMRDWQKRTTEMFQGKTFERSTPLGPVLVTGDEVDDARNLAISCSVDDVCYQQATTADMVFDPAALVQYISAIITLVPGDVILTGTPAGVGGARRPPVYLRPGQTVVTTISGIGEMINSCSTAQ